MNTLKNIAAATALLVGGITAANAAVVVLDFAGVVNPSNSTAIGGFYDGGVSGDGNTGTNYGVAFSSNALAINSYNGCCEPDSPTPGILYFLSGGAVTIDVAAGFDTGFSFYYASNTNAFVTVYDGLGGTGNILASLSLANNYSSNCGYCVWDPVGVSFAGIAKSIDFGGGADYVAYDDITFGSKTPGLPEPGSVELMMIAGVGMLASALRRRKPVAA